MDGKFGFVIVLDGDSEMRIIVEVVFDSSPDKKPMLNIGMW